MPATAHFAGFPGAHWMPLLGSESDQPVLPPGLSLARRLSSIPSAGSGTPPLFGDFIGTTNLSDFPHSCVAVVPLSGSRHGPALKAQAKRGISRLPVRRLGLQRRGHLSQDASVRA